MKITEVKNRTPELTERLLGVWEDSVRATHRFLSDSEIGTIKAYVPQALNGVALKLKIMSPPHPHSFS